MNRIVIILIGLISFAKAQEKAPSNYRYNSKQGIEFRKVDNKPSYLDDDSIWAFQDGGQWWQASSLTSKFVTSQQAGIVADSSTDQTAKLNVYFARSKTRGMILSNDMSGSVIIINGEVDFKNKPITADGSVRLEGFGKVKNLKISGPVYFNIISPNLQTENVTSNIDYLSACWLGVVVDSATNNKVALRKFKDIHRQNILFPAGKGFISDSSLYIPTDNSINMKDCPLIANHNLSNALRIGDSANSVRALNTKQVWNLRVRRSNTYPVLTSSDNTGILLINIENMEQINVSEVVGFWRGLEVRGYNNGAISSIVNIGQIMQCVEFIFLNNFKSGWVNAVTFKGGHLRNNSDFKVTGNPRMIGIRIGNRKYSNIASSNVFEGQTIEINNSNSIPVYIENGSNNVIKDTYAEANGENFCAIAPLPGNSGNAITPAYIYAGQNKFKDSSFYGLNYFAPARERVIERAYNTPIINIQDLTRVFFPYRGNGTSATIGGGLGVAQTCCFAKVSDTLVNAIVKDGYVRLQGNSSAISTPIINCSNVKQFYIKTDRLSSEPGVIQYKFFKANGLVLDSSGNRPTINSTINWIATLGGVWNTTGSPENITIINVPDSADKFQIFFNASSSRTNLSIRALQVGALGRAMPGIISSYQYPKVVSKPSAGTYRVGDKVYKIDGRSFYECTKAGTIYYTQPKAAIATYTINSNSIKLNVPVVTYEVNTFVRFNGGDYFVIGKNTVDNTLILEGPAAATGSGELTVPAFDFIEVGSGNGMQTQSDARATNNHTHNINTIPDSPVLEDGIYNPSFSGNGVVSNITGDSVGYSRNGKSVEVWGVVSVGTNGAGNAIINIPLPFTTRFPSDDKHAVGDVYVSQGANFIGNYTIGSRASSSSVYFSIKTTGALTYKCRFKFSYRMYNN